MSKETMEWLNDGSKIKLGFTSKRGEGYAWHFDASIAAQVSDDNDGVQQYYPGAIPVADVMRDILNWEALTAPVTFTDQNGVVHETTDQVIYRSDNAMPLKTGFKDGYTIHQFSEWLIEKVSIVTGVSVAEVVNINNGTAEDMLQLSTFGLLREGKQAWAQFELPESIETSHGIAFRPSLLAGTSHDGTIATMLKLVQTIVLCDNTFECARSEKSQAVKIKHTKYSNNTVANAADALGLVNSAADEFAADIDALIETKVSGLQFVKFIDAFVPMPDADGRAKTMAENKRETLQSLYLNDQRVAPFAGSAFGILQLTNTYAQHVAPIHKGTDRMEKRFSDALTGKTGERDSLTLDLLGKILANA